jgi:hypothetical protein
MHAHIATLRLSFVPVATILMLVLPHVRSVLLAASAQRHSDLIRRAAVLVITLLPVQ